MIESFDLFHINLFMEFIMFEANKRARDPIGGCLRLTENLQNKIVFVKVQLQLLLHHLVAFKAQVSHSTPPPSSDHYVQELPLQEPQEQQFQPQEKDSSCFNYNLQEYMNMLDTDNSVSLFRLLSS